MSKTLLDRRTLLKSASAAGAAALLYAPAFAQAASERSLSSAAAPTVPPVRAIEACRGLNENREITWSSRMRPTHRLSVLERRAGGLARASRRSSSATTRSGRTASRSHSKTRRGSINGRKQVTLADGSTLAFDRLVLAPGSTCASTPCPARRSGLSQDAPCLEGWRADDVSARRSSHGGRRHGGDVAPAVRFAARLAPMNAPA